MRTKFCTAVFITVGLDDDGSSWGAALVLVTPTD